MESVSQDLRSAIRMVRTSPAFTAVITLTVALGIGTNTAIFSIVNSLLLRSLPVAEPERLVTISSDTAISRGFTAGAGWNYAMWERLRQRVEAFDGAFAWTVRRLNLARAGEMQPVDGVFASGDFFTTLGVPAILGRTFTATDDVRGGGPDGPVAVISYGLWQRRFGGAANVIGAPLLINGVAFTIIGVTPPEFLGLEVGRTFEVTLPLGTEPLISGKNSMLDQPRALFLVIVLRLKRDQSFEAATAAIRAMQPQILGIAPEALAQFQPAFLREPFTVVPAAGGTSGAAAGMPGLRQRYERPLLTILAASAVVLLITCVNIANLLLARATARRHELSVRLAVGASRWRLARQLLVESVFLAGIGAIIGLMFAVWGGRTLVAQLSTSVDRVVLDLRLDWRVMAFAAAMALATAAVFGAVPAFRATRVAPIDALKDQGRSAAAHGRLNVSSRLVVAQVALSLVLVVVAGLFVQTFDRLANLPLGFDPERVLLVNVDTARARINPANRTLFYHQLVAAVAMVPGVAGAAGSLWTPAGGGGAGLMVDARGRSVDPERRVVANFITPGWFAAYGIAIRAGRDVTDRDTADALPVAVVNETFARRFLPGRNAVGETFDDSASSVLKNRTAVGVVGDAIYGSLRDTAPPTIYVPLAQSDALQPPGRTSITIGVRPVDGSPMPVVPQAAAVLTAVDPDLVFSFRPLADQVSASLAQERLVAMLSGFFGALALLLAGLGLYGVTSYSVGRRRAEIGIRMALGAQRADVLGMVLGHSAVLSGVGILLGLAGAAAVTRYFKGMLFGVTALDPTTFIAVSVAFATVALLAAFVPARRATKVDPLIALRSE